MNFLWQGLLEAITNRPTASSAARAAVFQRLNHAIGQLRGPLHRARRLMLAVTFHHLQDLVASAVCRSPDAR